MGEENLRAKIARGLHDYEWGGIKTFGNNDSDVEYWLKAADPVLANFAAFLRERSVRKQARALDVEQTIAEMLS